MLNSTKFLNKSNMYEPLHCWLKNGLLTSKAKQWHQRRKIITPAFHFKILEQYIEIFDKQSSIMMDILTKYGATDQVDLRKYVGLYTLDVICGKILFGGIVPCHYSNQLKLQKRQWAPV